MSGNIEKVRSSIVKDALNKVSEYVKSQISEREERAEFNEYILNRSYALDGDKYGIGLFCKSRSAEGMVYFSQDRTLYNSLYESYVFRKYIGINHLEQTKELTDRLDAISSGNTGVDLMKLFRSIGSRIKAVDLSTSAENNNIIRLFFDKD